MTRVLTALVLVPFATYVVLWSPQWLFLAVAGLVALLCFHEYSRIVQAHGIEPPGVVGYALGLALMAPLDRAGLVAAVAALIALAVAARRKDMAQVLPQAAALLLGVAYIFGGWRCGLALRALNPYWLLFAMVLNWIGDTAAYYAGRSLGRHKLAPQISPNKSVEGAVASLIASVAFGYAFLHRFFPAVTAGEALALSAIANIAGQAGDLAESALKRGAGIKDSGAWLPGHGGWLDRVDANLFTMPVVYVWLTWR